MRSKAIIVPGPQAAIRAVAGVAALLARRALPFLVAVLICGSGSVFAEGAYHAAPETKPGRIVTSYALTAPAHQDPDQHDGSTPKDWRLLGSNDDGRTWQVVDARTNELFAEGHLRRVFTVNNNTSYNIYRLEVTRTRDGTDSASLAELQLMGPVTGLNNESQLRMKISSSRAHPLRSPATQAFDGDPSTDWFDYGLGQAGGRWLQCQYTTNADIVVDNIAQLNVICRGFSMRESFSGQAAQVLPNSTGRTNVPVRKLVGYSLTSANDFYPRDPSDWELLASNDGGKSWDTLDVRQNETFPRRLQKREFVLRKPASYGLYRLKIDSVFAPALANSVQLAEFEPRWEEGESLAGLSLVVSARGENAPWEGVQSAFDRDLTTKWLDFSPGSTNRASWIQWQFVAIDGPPVVSLNRLLTIRPQQMNPMKLDLQAVVVGRGSGSVSVVDRSGFDVIELALPAEIGRPGDRVRLRGDLEFINEKPLLTHPEMEVLGQVQTIAPAETGAGASLDANQEYVSATIEGDAEVLTQDADYSTIRLTSEGGANVVLARILSPYRRQLPGSLNCRLRVRGVVESVADGKGHWIPGIVWASGPSGVTLVAPKDEDWNRWPEYSVKELTGTNFIPPGLVRVVGTVDEEDSGRRAILGEGTNRIMIYDRAGAAFPENSRIEAIGFLDRQRRRTVLRWAACRLAANRRQPSKMAIDAEHPVTEIGEVNRLRQSTPDVAFPVRLRGVITYICGSYINDDNIFYLQNGTNAIQIMYATEAGLTDEIRQEGMYAEIDGQNSRDGIIPTGFAKFLGKGQMPEPIKNSFDAMMSPQNAGRWAQVDGVVSGYNDGRLTLLVEGKELTVWVNQITLDDQCRVPGSRLRVSGVSDPILNGRDQMLGSRLLVPSSECIEVIEAGPTDPFSVRKVDIASVLLSSPGAAGGQMQMVRSEGIVTYKGPQMLCLQEKDSGMRVFLQRENMDISPGDRVEVAGLALPDGFSPKLVQAVVRKVGQGDLPPAGVTDFFQAYLQSSQDATRGQVDAIFEGRGASDSTLKLELRCQATKRNFFAYLPAVTPLPTSMLPGARVRLRGVIKLQAEEPLDANQVVTAFEMYLNSASDIQVLEAPSWWTARHTLWALGGLGAVLIVSIGWISALRRQVRRQTRALKQENWERKQAQGELAAANAALQTENLERKQIEAELRQSEEHSRQIADKARVLAQAIEQCPTSVVITDPAGDITYVNPKFTQITGYSLHEVAGRNPRILKSGKTPDEEYKLMWETIRAGREWHGLFHNRKKNGELYWESASVAPVVDEAGKITHFLAVKEDITAIKQAEAELERAHRELVQASRMAGMAEVATSVLHNVGNVLNSINVSATLVDERVRNSRVADVRRLADLLEEHAEDRAAFLTKDPKGRKVPAFIGQLAKKLGSEQADMLEEISSLRRNVEHVKEIITMQQSYARVSGVFEDISVTDLLEDSLRMNAGSLARHDIKVVREFGDLPLVCTDKHKVLQILINLVRNAKYACDESGRSDKQVILRASNGDGRVKIAVIDNGVGIPPENINRIFNHGFTTRKDGHGFGLHSGALAAKELGGALTVHSDGKGRGAAFTLELPCEPSSVTNIADNGQSETAAAA
ncbi:MAG TPA: PAS domain S-box protein [Candidatus Baltobacteraceae bacterium]|jgi:PAS domain S-box-containing protein|nr:PAS domain S-box protein [Candidatus Baltobacteraceae bacterium]